MKEMHPRALSTDLETRKMPAMVPPAVCANAFADTANQMMAMIREELMHDGIAPSCAHAVEAGVIELGLES